MRILKNVQKLVIEKSINKNLQYNSLIIGWCKNYQKTDELLTTFFPYFKATPSWLFQNKKIKKLDC